MSPGMEIVGALNSGQIDWPTALKQLAAVDWPQTVPRGPLNPLDPQKQQDAEDDMWLMPESGSLAEVLVALSPDRGAELNNALYAQSTGGSDGRT